MEEPHDGADAGTGDPRRPLPSALRRAYDVISAGELAVGAVILAVLLVLVLVQTATRFLPMGGFVWSGELARFCLVWLTFGVSGVLMERDRHITLDVIDFAAEGRAVWLTRAFANAVVAVVCAAFVVESVAMITDDTAQTTPAMQLPLQLVYVIPFLGFALTALRAALAVIWRRPTPPSERTAPDGSQIHADEAAEAATGGSTA